MSYQWTIQSIEHLVVSLFSRSTFPTLSMCAILRARNSSCYLGLWCHITALYANGKASGPEIADSTLQQPLRWKRPHRDGQYAFYEKRVINRAAVNVNTFFATSLRRLFCIYLQLLVSSVMIYFMPLRPWPRQWLVVSLNKWKKYSRRETSATSGLNLAQSICYVAKHACVLKELECF